MIDVLLVVLALVIAIEFVATIVSVADWLGIGG